MNKQEVMRKLHEAGFNCKAIKYASQFDKGYNNGIAYAINLLDKLDESEKPVLTKEEAEWLERLKEGKGNELDLCDKADLLYYITREGFVYNKFGFYTDESDDFISLEKKDKTTKMRLVWALLIGYTLEPEKHYTAKLKISNEYLRLDCDGVFGHFRVDRDYILGGAKAYQFTKGNLVKYHIWENDNYDVEVIE